MKTILLISLSFLIAACSATKTATKTSDDPRCTTAVEGNFKCRVLYVGTAPAFFVKTSEEHTKNLRGKIIEITDEGILFEAARVGVFGSPETRLFRYKDIVFAIDSSRKALYGTPPLKESLVWDMDLVVRRTDDTTANPLRLELKAGEKFSFCVPPGDYALYEIYFNHGPDIDIGVKLPLLTFRVQPGKANYIGDLLLDMDSTDAPGSCIIPYKVYKSQTAAMGVMFGLVGGILAALATDFSVKEGHRLRVSIDEEFETTTMLPLVSSVARLGANQGEVLPRE